MESVAAACPACGSSETQGAEIAWESGQVESVPPPVPRLAATNAGRFYGFGFLGLVAWTLAAIYVCSFVAARAESVVLVAGVAVAGGLMQIVRLFTGSPKPTADQISALDEWKTAHSEWQRTWLCLRCGRSFVLHTPPQSGATG